MRTKDVVALFEAGEKFEILSFDDATKTKTFKLVKKAWETKKNAAVVRITDTDSGKSIVCTPEHKIFTQNRGYVEASQLKSDDKLQIN
jgi:intein/homing endonuclease